MTRRVVEKLCTKKVCIDCLAPREDRVVADVWDKDVWEFQAKSGSSGACRFFLYFLGKIAVQEMSGKRLEFPRHPFSPDIRGLLRRDKGKTRSGI